MYPMVAIIVVLFGVMQMNPAYAGECPDYLIKAMQEEGLSRNQIDTICAKAGRYKHSKGAICTPEKVRRDLVGWSVGPAAILKVPGTTTGSVGSRTGSGDDARGNDHSYHAFVPVPMGIMFDRTNITDVRILEQKVTGQRATLVVYVATVSSYAGKLRLRYEYVADEWVLRELENVSFRAR